MKSRSDLLVSVIIPTYNRGNLVGRAIDSVLDQTHKNTEIIVVDDGSTDRTAQVLRCYGERIRVIAQDNSGPAVARNRGIKLAGGEMIAFLDSDDYWLPTKLATQIDLLAKAGGSAVCCLCNCRVQYATGASSSTFKIAGIHPTFPAGLWTNPANVLLTRFVLFNQAAVIRKESLARVGGFDERLRFGEDYDLPLRLSLQGPWVITQDQLAVYHAASPGSWAEQAKREEARLYQDLYAIRTELTLAIENTSEHFHLRRIARREMKRASRELRIAKLRQYKFPCAAALARSASVVERLRHAIYRRSPLYPQLVIEQL
jgi:glycosyltransferase involved in cell wall biosynthesis